MREKDLLLECISYIDSNISSYYDMLDTFKEIGFTDKELYLYGIKDINFEYEDLKAINEEEYWKLCNEIANYIKEDFKALQDKNKNNLKAICEDYNMDLESYLYVEGYNDFDELLEDLK